MLGGRVLYVGRASALRSRVASYWSDCGFLAAAVRFNGGSDASSRLRSSHAASWAESQLTASIRATRATIGAR